jgi:NADH:ubiquinone oxidoreductase subunit H
MKLPITVISLIENLLLLLPALLAVAYVTVAERKTMASMQRRLGPNAVGLEKSIFMSAQATTKRLFHSSCSFKDQENITNFLYENITTPAA